MKPIDLKFDSQLNAIMSLIKKILSLKVVIKNFKIPKTLLLNDMLLIGQKKFLLLKNTVPWIYVINDLNGEEIVGSFYEKELQKTNQKKVRIKKVIKRKLNKLQVKWKKGYDNSFNS